MLHPPFPVLPVPTVDGLPLRRIGSALVVAFLLVVVGGGRVGAQPATPVPPAGAVTIPSGEAYHGSGFSAPYCHLSGERLDRIGDGIYEIRRGVFTTCEGDDPPWSFRFNSGTADLDDIVYGRDASFWVKRVPLLPWEPFFAASLRRERQSGFLFPEFGQFSRRGYFAKVPCYWATQRLST